MANFDAVNLVISAEDKYSEEFTKAGDSVEKVLKKTQDQIKIERAELEQYMELLIATSERRKQQQLDIQQMTGDAHKAGQKELERLIKLEERYSKKVGESETNYTALLEVREDLESKKFDTMHEYFEFWESGSKSVSAGMRKANQNIKAQTGAINKLKSAMGGYGAVAATAANKGAQSMKKFGMENANALNTLNQQAPMAVQALQDLGGQQFGQTIQGLVGISQQLAEMQKIQKQGGEISSMMKLGLVTQALSMLKPVVQGAIAYFRDFAGAATEASKAIDQTKEMTAKYIKRNDELTRRAKEWIKLADKSADKEKIWAQETERLSDERDRLNTAIERETKELEALAGMWGKYFQAEDKKMVEARLAGLKEERAALQDNRDAIDEGRNAADKAIETEKKRQEAAKYFYEYQNEQRHRLAVLQLGEDKRAIAHHNLVRKILEDKKRGMEWEQGYIQEQHQRLDMIHDLMEAQEAAAKAKIKAEKDAADAKRKADKEENDRERDALRRKSMLIGLSEKHAKTLGMELKIRQEQLKETGLYTDEEIKLISEQEDKYRKEEKRLKKYAPVRGIEDANVGRLLSGRTTNEMTEGEKRQIAIQTQLKVLAGDQLKALEKMFVTELSSAFGKN